MKRMKGSQTYFPARSVLFRKEPSGITYRVPALIYIARSATFLAFCEERLSPADAQAHLLVMRKVYDVKSSLMFARGHRSMNPCPVYDDFTGTIFLFFIAVLGHTTESYQLVTGKNVTRLCYVSSNDQGDTWSPVTDLTKKVIGDTIKEWATFALGPGHGIQLKSGRLLIPAYAYHIDCKECFGQMCMTTPHSFCFHSDTHGRVWKFGEAIPGPDSVECQMVSVDEEDGTNILYCNARSPLGCRVQSLSLDDGAVFQNGQLVQKLVEPRNGCHGSIIGFPAPLQLLEGKSSGFRPTWVVYSHPTWPSARRDLGVYLSLFPRDPDSWCGPWIIYEGPSAYSDMACIELSSPGAPPVTAFACLFENGMSTAYDEISFSIFTLYEVIENLPQRKLQHRNNNLKKQAGNKRKRRKLWHHCCIS
uniref:exo-alpha-sialidase n=1 Tax=Denticeps clupeoides TaxID=299321 RepID=A0AAY4D2F1_9TELE